jgi:hypothetical protein
VSRTVAADATHHWSVRFRPAGRTDWSGWHGPWTVQVTRTGPAPVPPGTDATLAALTVSPGSLSPAFAPGTTSYSVAVAASVETVELTAVESQAAATVSVSVQQPMELFAVDSPRTVDVTATAPDGATTRIFQVTVTVDVDQGTHTAFINGLPVGSLTITTWPTGTTDAPNRMRLGSATNDGAPTLQENSRFAIVRFYDRALNGAEIADNYLRDRNRFGLGE